MEVPFFLTKLLELIPRVNISIIDSPSKATMRTSGFTSRKFEEGYIKGYQRNSEWQPYTRPMLHSNLGYHSDVCRREYQVETLDGSEYYLCQHGVRVR